MIKAFIFDCFGVLTTDHWKEFVATLPPDQIEEARALNYKYDAARLNELEFMEAVKELTGRLPQAVEKLLDNEIIKNDQLLEYIKRLKPSYKVGMLSNIGSNWIRDKFLDSDEQGLFDEMVFSYEVGLAKPDPEIFQLMADRLGESSVDCVFIDDSQGHCAAAAKVGMRTVIYENFEQLKRELKPLLANSEG
jgi:HAD superfamily hydrolase (TIGR01509 family)